MGLREYVSNADAGNEGGMQKKNHQGVMVNGFSEIFGALCFMMLNSQNDGG